MTRGVPCATGAALLLFGGRGSLLSVGSRGSSRGSLLSVGSRSSGLLLLLATDKSGEHRGQHQNLLHICLQKV